jgi:ribosomal protein S15P/S13E
MALLQEKKQEIINAYQVHTTDTGSSDRAYFPLEQSPQDQQERPLIPSRFAQNDWTTQELAVLHPKA